MESGRERFLFFITNPLVLIVLNNVVAWLFYFIIPSRFFLAFTFENKFFTCKAFLLYILFFSSFVLGYILTPNLVAGRISEKNYAELIPLIKIFAFISFVLTAFGYVLWFKEIFINFDYYLNLMLLRGVYSTRKVLEEHMIHGITTFTQFGIISVILYTLLFVLRRKKIYVFPIIIVVILSLIRAVFFGERLALIEVVVPSIFVYLRFNPRYVKKFLFVGVILFALLWSTELLRSYMSKTYNSNYSAFEFLIYRFLAYFSTTINNSNLIFDKFHPFQDFFPSTLKGIYNVLHMKISSELQYKDLLITYLNPEYNNKGVWAELYYDSGLFGLVFAFLLGSVTKILYLKYKNCDFIGVVVYPIFMVFLLQSYRVLYVNSSRVWYSYIIIFLLFFLRRFVI